jgi:hypothetical protein
LKLLKDDSCSMQVSEPAPSLILVLNINNSIPISLVAWG